MNTKQYQEFWDNTLLPIVDQSTVLDGQDLQILQIATQMAWLAATAAAARPPQEIPPPDGEPFVRAPEVQPVDLQEICCPRCGGVGRVATVLSDATCDLPLSRPCPCCHGTGLPKTDFAGGRGSQ